MDAIFPGLRGMVNYHPVFVHFPIALWVAALLFELAVRVRASEELHRAAVYLLYLATLLAIPTVLTGLYAEHAAPEEGAAHGVVELHRALMLAASGFSAALCGLAFYLEKRSSARLRALFLAGLLALVGLMAVGADRGAELVYKYGTAVNWATATQQK